MKNEIEETARSRIGEAYLTPSLGEPRFARQWGVIAAGISPQRGALFGLPRRAALVVFLAGALATVAVVFAWRHGNTAAPFDGAAIETAASAHTWTMPDGAEIAMSDQTRLRVLKWSPERVVVELERGEARFDVPHVDGRVWLVQVGDFEVRVVGTRFTVRGGASPSDGVGVSVERGRVEVASRSRPHDVRMLGAGESWHADASPRAAASALPPAAAAPDDSGAGAVADAPAASEPAASATDAAPPSSPSWETLARERRYKDAYDALGPQGFSSALAGANAERLLRLAEVARAAGHARDADRAFDALRRRFRGDARAGLAAFELGRLRMDSLGDASGALEALADAIQLAPGAPFREDAEARRVQLLSRSGAVASCEQARASYLARYPAGAHTALVSSLCPPR
jgi:transmembrane sensor